MAADQLDALSWSEMRDELISHAPLDWSWIARVNKVRPNDIIRMVPSLEPVIHSRYCYPRQKGV